MSVLQPVRCHSSLNRSQDYFHSAASTKWLHHRPYPLRPRLIKRCKAVAGDDNKGNQEGWAKKIKDSLPDVESGSGTSAPRRSSSSLQDEIRRSEHAALDVWNNESFFKIAGIMAGVLIFLLIVGGPP